MKLLIFTISLAVTMPVFSQVALKKEGVGKETNMPVIRPGKYTWVTPGERKEKIIGITTILEGSAHDMEHLAVDAASLPQSKRKEVMKVPPDEEHLFLIKSGVMNISFRDSTWSIGAGSVALLLPGEEFSVWNTGKAVCNYYRMRYRSNTPKDMTRGEASGGSFVKDWNKLTFRAHDRGGVRAYFEKATAMSKRFEMHVTTLKPGLRSHAPHTHHAEEIILMLEDSGEGRSETEMLIGENIYHGTAGDLYYIRTNLLHGIKNTGTATCSYFAFQFE